MHRKTGLIALLAVSCIGRPQTYVATVLPPAPGHSYTLGTGAGTLHYAGVGNQPGTDFALQSRAVLFKSGGGYVDVTPPGRAGAIINDSDIQQHVGGATPGGGYPAYAYLWVDTSPRNMHPAGYSVSELLGVGGGHQVGYAVLGFYCSECGRFVQRHAGLWQGTASSFRLLHSRTHSYTVAAGTDGRQHVGNGQRNTTGYVHALIWNGTANSISLHPSAAFETSLATATHRGQQVGSVSGEPTDSYTHAALWTGSAGSFVDLNPRNYLQSSAYSVRNFVQVGAGSLLSESWRYRALAWRGTAASVTDLHALLPSQYRWWNSSAEDVNPAGHIVGFVESAGRYRPVIWRRTS